MGENDMNGLKQKYYGLLNYKTIERSDFKEL